MNDYLRDRAMRRGGRGRDYRNESRNDHRNDYRNESRNDYRNPYGSRGGYVVDSRLDDEYRRPYNEKDYQETQHHGMMEEDYEMDYRSDYRSDYSDGEDEDYEKDLKKWVEKLKKKDRYGMSKEQVIKQAKNMGVEFEEFDEMEFYAVYLMMLSDNKNLGENPMIYFKLAKNFLEDDDVEMTGSAKLCAYLYEIVLGGKEED